jgi:hypothetical protein
MAAVYEDQMTRFDSDRDTGQWRRLYSVDNMPDPSNTQTPADVAAMLAFYSPTNFCKFQKLAAQQLMEWEANQTSPSPLPFASPAITLLDLGAGLGIASLAAIDVFATWADIAAESGYPRLGASVRIISVEPDPNKQAPRNAMLNHLSALLDRQRIRVERVTDVLSPYPTADCLQQVLNAASAGSFAICCMSNFLSSRSVGRRSADDGFSLQPGSELMEPPCDEGSVVFAQTPELVENAARYADATAWLLGRVPSRGTLLMASELRQSGAAIRTFADALEQSLDLLVRWNRVRFVSPVGSYWHSLRESGKSLNADWATGYWTLAHWVRGGANVTVQDTPGRAPDRGRVATALPRL